jgi:hypothetical protein
VQEVQSTSSSEEEESDEIDLEDPHFDFRNLDPEIRRRAEGCLQQ